MILRDATAADSDALLAWRNDPRVFANFRLAAPVHPEIHKAWFAASLHNWECHIWIAEEERPIGMIRLDERTEGDYEVSIIVDPDHQGIGLGTQMLRFACNENGALFAEVKQANAASRRIFEKCEFRQISREGEYVLYRRDRK
jgi:RimJ/RimL family protein N-acetyltransferase